MSKLLKLSETHYIVADDSEIQEGDWIFNYSGVKYNEQVVSQCTKNAATNWQQNIHINNGTKSIRDCIKKITHSTQPLEKHPDLDYPFFHNIDSLSLSEVEEAINGYSVEKMANSHCEEQNRLSNSHDHDSFIEGFKAHQELVKDKLFTAQGVINIVEKSRETGLTAEYFIIKHLLPKTEWDVTFDEQGKLKLVE